MKYILIIKMPDTLSGTQQNSVIFLPDRSLLNDPWRPSEDYNPFGHNIEAEVQIQIIQLRLRLAQMITQGIHDDKGTDIPVPHAIINALRSERERGPPSRGNSSEVSWESSESDMGAFHREEAGNSREREREDAVTTLTTENTTEILRRTREDFLNNFAPDINQHVPWSDSDFNSDEEAPPQPVFKTLRQLLQWQNTVQNNFRIYLNQLHEYQMELERNRERGRVDRPEDRPGSPSIGRGIVLQRRKVSKRTGGRGLKSKTRKKSKKHKSKTRKVKMWSQRKIKTSRSAKNRKRRTRRK
tara:strand:+ start:1122 stop:2018 length:897 start_codon:yes stop_codon:yes gene_type:complete